MAAAFVSMVGRWRSEARNRRVEITLDYGELQELAAAEGRPLPDVLRFFRRAGATSVAVQEDTIGSLEDARRIEVNSAPSRRITLLWPAAGDLELLARIKESVDAKTEYRVTVPEGYTGGGAHLSFDLPYPLIRPLGVGIDPKVAEEIRAAGLGVVGRVGNWDAVGSDGLRWVYGQLKRQGVGTVIFSGDAIPGFKGYIADDPRFPGRATTESLLREFDLNYGAVEFVKQRGDGLLMREAADRVARVHTVSGAEMVAADIPANVQRFLLAARERNIRLLFVRLFPQEPEALKANVEYVQKIARGLARGRLTPGPAHGFHDLETANVLPFLRLFMGLGLAAAWCLLLNALTGMLAGTSLRWLRYLAAAGAVLLALLPLAPGTAGAKLAAFAAACLFPAWALVYRDHLAPVRGGATLPVRDVFEHAFRRFLGMTGITLLGAALIVGLLGERVFLIKADAFMGIKASQVLPLLIAGVIYALHLRATAERPLPRVLDDARKQVFTLAGKPVLMWQVAAGAIVLVALALIVLRSGNDPGVGVSALELRVRSLLDMLLYTRPRFKEFLIGHPALIVALGLAVTGRRAWALPFFLAGALGQASLLNTFCHLHTPLLVSLLRALLGVAIGVIIGVMAYLVVDRLLRRRPVAARARAV